MCALQTLKPLESNVSENKTLSGKQKKIVSNGFSDNRLEAKQMQRLQETMSFSSQADQITQMKAIASGPVTQLKTEIKHKTQDFTYPHNGTNVTESVGEEMTAYLDPTDVVVGSGTGTPQLDLYHSVQGATHPMIRT